MYLIAMRLKGITYDAGYVNLGVSSHEPFDPDAVRRDLRVIRDDLHCDAVRVTGGDPARLEVVGAIAADLGLEVWFSPFTIDLAADAMLSLLADCAERAERLRSGGADVVFVTGAELSLLNVGFLPGDTCQDRIDALLHAPRAELGPAIAKVPALVNAFLREALDVVRARFGGKVTYASIPFEGVDWTPFDIVSVDAYRTVEVVEQYRDAIRALVAQGKPVAITEFGSATYKGAADRGGRGGLIVEWDGAVPARLDGAYVRDETEQATCGSCWRSSPPRASTRRSRSPSPPSTCRTATTPARTWTWPATASSRCSTTARGNRRRPSRRSPPATRGREAGSPPSRGG
jgi:hypothetical protein